MKKVAVKKTKAVKKTAAKKTTAKKTTAKKTAKKTAKAAPKAKVAKAVSKAKTAKAAPKAKVSKAAPKTAVRTQPKAPKLSGLASLPDVVQKAVKFLDDRKAENIAVLDLRDLANISEFFVIVTAANAPHLKALGDGLQRLFKNEQYEGYRFAGTGDSGWAIIDYDGVMVHVFSAEMRSLYDLEKLWKDAKRVAIDLKQL